jgi:mannose-6-phosphate isomerase-like protein (cupin superfamily)
MRVIDHQRQPREEWRPGVLTRMRVAAVVGSVQLCLFEQWCAPGHGAPTHHHAVEEVLSVIAGQAEVWQEAERTTLMAGQSLVVPAGRPHGFKNNGQVELHIQATLAAPIFEAAYDDQREVPRRWGPK